MDERTRDTTIMNDQPPVDEQVDLTTSESTDEQVSLEHILSKPIQAHGEEVRILHWREPTGGDIEIAGNPVYLDFSGASPTIAFNEKKMATMMSRLTQVPPSSIRQLTAKDWNAVAWKLFRFFTPPGA
jgi:Phage tail assembly chaperone proteins, E, or 41 or 14